MQKKVGRDCPRPACRSTPTRLTGTRPAGLRFGVAGQTPTAGSGPTAPLDVVLGDIGILLAALTQNGTGDDPALICSPARASRIRGLAPGFGLPIFPSATLANNLLIAVDCAAFVSSISTVEWDVSHETYDPYGRSGGGAWHIRNADRPYLRALATGTTRREGHAPGFVGIKAAGGHRLDATNRLVMTMETEVERILRLREEADQGRRDIQARREARERGEGPEEWVVPPPATKAAPRPSDAAWLGIIRTEVSRQIEARVDALVKRGIESTVSKLTAAIGTALGIEREKTRALIQAEIRKAITETESPVESTPRPRRVA